MLNAPGQEDPKVVRVPDLLAGGLEDLPVASLQRGTNVPVR